MTIFIQKGNIKIIWDVISLCPIFNELFTTDDTKKEWFNRIIGQVDDQLSRNVSMEELGNVNRETIKVMMANLKRKQLSEKHSCPINASAELADTLIRGKKQIVNDEYAVLIVDDTQNFFQRKLATNKWVIDKTVKPEIFINNNDLFKNINNKKNKTANSSDTITVHRNMYVAEFKSRLDELDNRLTVENSIIAQNLSGFITRNNNLKYIQSHKQNIF